MRMKEGLMMRYCQSYTGQQMPVLGMASTIPVLETSTKRRLLRLAIDFDTAYYYGNEQESAPSGNQISPRLFVTSKVNSSKYLATKQAIKQALDKMQLDYLDLMLIH